MKYETVREIKLFVRVLVEVALIVFILYMILSIRIPTANGQPVVEAYELPSVYSMRIDGILYTKDSSGRHARFVAITRPADTKMIVVSRSRALNVISGYGIHQLPQADKYIAFPVVTDSRLTNDQWFTVHTGLNIAAAPYFGPQWIGKLPKRTCADLGFKCTDKRRVVRTGGSDE